MQAALQPKTVTLVAFWHFAKSSSTFKFKCSAPQIYSLPISSNPSNLQYSSKYKMHSPPKDLRRVVLRELLNKNGKQEKEQIHPERLTELENKYKSLMLRLSWPNVGDVKRTLRHLAMCVNSSESKQVVLKQRDSTLLLAQCWYIDIYSTVLIAQC